MDEKFLINGEFESNRKGMVLGVAVSLFSLFDFILFLSLEIEGFLTYCWLLGIVLGIWLVYYNYNYRKYYELTITDKRIYGKVMSNYIDLPFDKVSSVKVNDMQATIQFSTSSGIINVPYCTNKNEIVEIVISQLNKRQEITRKEETNITNTTTSEDVDILRKYKTLLTEGIITQEEFDAKKKELLDL